MESVKELLMKAKHWPIKCHKYAIKVNGKPNIKTIRML